MRWLFPYTCRFEISSFTSGFEKYSKGLAAVVLWFSTSQAISILEYLHESIRHARTHATENLLQVMFQCLTSLWPCRGHAAAPRCRPSERTKRRFVCFLSTVFIQKPFVMAHVESPSYDANRIILVTHTHTSIYYNKIYRKIRIERERRRRGDIDCQSCRPAVPHWYV